MKNLCVLITSILFITTLNACSHKLKKQLTTTNNRTESTQTNTNMLAPTSNEDEPIQK
jgi:hypothetical protein